jgi:hypothetical protein
MKRVLIIAFLALQTVVLSARANADSTKNESFDRELPFRFNTFVPKGTLTFGLAVSYNNMDLGNFSYDDAGYSTLWSLIGGVNGSVTTFKVTPNVYYFVGKNLAIGARFMYGATNLNIGDLNLNIMDGMNLGLKDYGFNKYSYSGSIAARYYMGLGESKRFGVFAELRGTGGYAQGEMYKMTEDGKYGTYQQIATIDLAAIPGICIYVFNNVAFEVALNMFGVRFQHIDQVTNQVDKSSSASTKAYFKPDLLSLEFGLAYNFQLIRKGKNRAK